MRRAQVWPSRQRRLCAGGTSGASMVSTLSSGSTGSGTWRDTIETVLSDMAQYCAEVALQKIPAHVAAKIAGPAVFWPVGLSLDDIISLFEVSVAAGTTGKPRNGGDREAWATIFPQILAAQTEIFTLQANPATAPLAAAKAEALRETMRRFGDESDLSRFLLVSNGNVTGIVDRLVSEGLALRARRRGDRRTSVISLTGTGRATFRAMATAHERWVDELLGAVSRTDARRLTAMLKAFRSNWEART